MLTSDIGTSNSLVSKLINGELPACPATHMGYVDVRDVAKAHIFSMLNDNLPNHKRIIVSESEMFFVDVGRILNDAGFKNHLLNRCQKLVSKDTCYICEGAFRSH